MVFPEFRFFICNSANMLSDTTSNSWIVLYNRLIRIFRVSRFLCFTSLTGTAIGFYLIGLYKTEIAPSGFLSLAALVGGMLPLFGALDARSRYQEYKKIKDMFFENGFKPKIVNLFIHSRCQRDALTVAARDLGLASHLAQYYHEKGYRRRHILPDITFKQPGLYFTVRYWKHTLFVQKYRSKYFLW